MPEFIFSIAVLSLQVSSEPVVRHWNARKSVILSASFPTAPTYTRSLLVIASPATSESPWVSESGAQSASLAPSQKGRTAMPPHTPDSIPVQLQS